MAKKKKKKPIAALELPIPPGGLLVHNRASVESQVIAAIREKSPDELAKLYAAMTGKQLIPLRESLDDEGCFGFAVEP